MPQIQITCDTSDAEIRYTLNGADPDESSSLYSNILDINEVTTVKAIAYKEGFTPSNIVSELVGATLTDVSVGNTYTIDGIEVLCIKEGQAYSSDGGATLVDDGTVPEVSNHPIFVDKNHDLVYYISGDDCVNQDINDPDGTDCINYNYKYGYEWGGRGTSTGITDTSIGTGLTNTNSLISMNLQPNTSGWYVVWDKVKKFRETYGDKWFVPSKDELNLVYTNRDSLANLSKAAEPHYWSSSEGSGNSAWYQLFNTGGPLNFYKSNKYLRVRLCRQI